MKITDFASQGTATHSKPLCDSRHGGCHGALSPSGSSAVKCQPWNLMKMNRNVNINIINIINHEHH
jgi:hypothetical protein